MFLMQVRLPSLLSVLTVFQEIKERSAAEGTCMLLPPVLLGAESCVRGSTGPPRRMWGRAACWRACNEVSQPWSCLGISSNLWQKSTLP